MLSTTFQSEFANVFDVAHIGDTRFTPVVVTADDVTRIYKHSMFRKTLADHRKYLVRIENDFDAVELPRKFPIPHVSSQGANFLFSNNSGLGMLTQGTDFLMMDTELMAYKKVATGIAHVTATHNHFALITTDMRVVVCDAGGKIVGETDVAMREIHVLEFMLAVWTVDNSLLVFEPDSCDFRPIPGLCGQVQYVTATRNVVCVLTDDGRVWVRGSTVHGAYVGVDDGFIPGLSNVTQVVHTVAAGAALTSDGCVFAWGDPKFGGSPEPGFVGKLPPVQTLLRTYTSILGVTRMDGEGQGRVYGWSNAWFKTYGRGMECATACVVDVPGLTAANIVNVYTCKTSWLVHIKTHHKWVALGDMMTNGPVRGLEQADISRVVENDYAFAMTNAKGELYVIGSPAHGGINDRGNYGRVDTSGRTVKRVRAYNSMFVAVMDNNHLLFWGAFRNLSMNFAMLGVTASMQLLLLTKDNDAVFALDNGLVYRNLDILYDGHKICNDVQFMYGIEHDGCVYTAVLCGDKAGGRGGKCSGFAGDGCLLPCGTSAPTSTCPPLRGTDVDKLTTSTSSKCSTPSSTPSSTLTTSMTPKPTTKTKLTTPTITKQPPNTNTKTKSTPTPTPKCLPACPSSEARSDTLVNNDVDENMDMDMDDQENDQENDHENDEENDEENDHENDEENDEENDMTPLPLPPPPPPRTPPYIHYAIGTMFVMIVLYIVYLLIFA